jgi:hypothetical protein
LRRVWLCQGFPMQTWGCRPLIRLSALALRGRRSRGAPRGERLVSPLA